MVCAPYEHVPPSRSRIAGDYLPTSTGILWPVPSRFGFASFLSGHSFISVVLTPQGPYHVFLCSAPPLRHDISNIFPGSLLRCLLPSCGICFSFLQRILAHQNFGGVRNLTRGRHLLTTPARLCLCRRSRHGRRRLFAFNLSLLRQTSDKSSKRPEFLLFHNHFSTTVLLPLEPAEYSVSHYTLILEISQRNTPNTRTHFSDRKTDRPRK